MLILIELELLSFEKRVAKVCVFVCGVRVVCFCLLFCDPERTLFSLIRLAAVLSFALILGCSYAHVYVAYFGRLSVNKHLAFHCTCVSGLACGGVEYYCSAGTRNTVLAGYYSTGGDETTRTGYAGRDLRASVCLAFDGLCCVSLPFCTRVLLRHSKLARCLLVD